MPQDSLGESGVGATVEREEFFQCQLQLGVAMAINQYGAGLMTGQISIDDVLNAIDAAWKLGPD